MSPFELRRVPKLTADASAEQRAGWPLAGVGALAAAPRAASDGARRRRAPCSGAFADRVCSVCAWWFSSEKLQRLVF